MDKGDDNKLPNGTAAAQGLGNVVNAVARPMNVTNLTGFDIVNLTWAYFIACAMDDNQDSLSFSINNGTAWAENDSLVGQGTGATCSGEENFWVIENKTLKPSLFIGNFTYRFNITAGGGETGWFDYVNITGYRFGAFNVTASVGTEQALINTTVNDTSADGGACTLQWV